MVSSFHLRLSLLALFLSGPISHAIEEQQCPETVRVQVRVKSVYQDSKYREVPGWKDAQQTLMELQDLELSLRLSERRRGSCHYRDANSNFANLRTMEFRDPDGDVNEEDQLLLGFRLRNSWFRSYIPVERYSADGLALFSRPFELKVKARLKRLDGTQWVDYDLGMISVVAD